MENHTLYMQEVLSSIPPLYIFSFLKCGPHFHLILTLLSTSITFYFLVLSKSNINLFSPIFRYLNLVILILILVLLFYHLHAYNHSFNVRKVHYLIFCICSSFHKFSVFLHFLLIL